MPATTCHQSHASVPATPHERGATTVSRTMVKNIGDAGRSWPKPLRDRADRVSGIFRRREAHRPLRHTSHEGLGHVGVWCKWKPFMSSSTVTLSRAFVRSVLTMCKGLFRSRAASAGPTIVPRSAKVARAWPKSTRRVGRVRPNNVKLAASMITQRRPDLVGPHEFCRHHPTLGRFVSELAAQQTRASLGIRR